MSLNEVKAGGTTLASLQAVDFIANSEPQKMGHQGPTLDSLPDHLRVSVENVSDQVSKETKGELAHILQKYQNTFVGPGDKLGRTGLVKHTIDTGDHKPIELPLRRPPIAQKPIICDEVHKILAAGIIESSDSPWAAPVVLVKKKTGEIRFCVDFRKLNEITRKDAFPLPRVDESLDQLCGSRRFSTLDLAQGFFQVEMDEKDKEKTAFSTPLGLYQFNVLPLRTM